MLIFAFFIALTICCAAASNVTIKYELLFGSGKADAYGIALWNTGGAAKAYTTGSTGVPTTSNGNGKFYAAKIDISGNLVVNNTAQGGIINNRGYSIAVDNSNNWYACGGVYGAIDGQTYSGSSDVAVIKYNDNGDRQWTRMLGSTGLDFAYGIAVDADGNSYTTGSTSASPFDGNTVVATDTFVVKYSTSGSKVASILLSGTEDETGNGIAFDSAGFIYVVGRTTSSLGSNTNAGSKDIFVAKYNSALTLQYVKQYGSTTSDEGVGIAAGTGEYMFVTGFTNGNLNGETGSGSMDAFVMKILRTDGSVTWTKLFGSSSSDYGYGVATTTAGYVYITGSSSGNYDGYQKFSNVSSALFVTKLSQSTGEKQWSYFLQKYSNSLGYGISVDSSSNVYVAGNADNDNGVRKAYVLALSQGGSSAGGNDTSGDETSGGSSSGGSSKSSTEGPAVIAGAVVAAVVGTGMIFVAYQAARRTTCCEIRPHNSKVSPV